MPDLDTVARLACVAPLLVSVTRIAAARAATFTEFLPPPPLPDLLRPAQPDTAAVPPLDDQPAHVIAAAAARLTPPATSPDSGPRTP